MIVALSDTVWIALFAALPPSIIALATLIGVIYVIIKGGGNFDILKTLLDGKLTEMIEAIKTSSEMKGKMELLEKKIPDAASIPQTTVIMGDRRVEKKDEIK